MITTRTINFEFTENAPNNNLFSKYEKFITSFQWLNETTSIRLCDYG